MGSGCWGPDSREAAACITFDHLGEAAQISTGQWAAGTPIGSHPSVTRILPDILAVLRDFRATCEFFVEAWNFAVYPEAVQSIVDAGHDVGWHGWLHESWHTSTKQVLDEALARSKQVFDALGINPRGARPPGGLMGHHSLDMLSAAGFEYVSLAGDIYGQQHDIALIPFAWATVDGCYYVDQFAPLRVPPGKQAVGPAELLTAYREYIDHTIARRGLASFVFHVPWQDSTDRLDAIATLTEELSGNPRVWLASPGEIADCIRSQQSPALQTVHIDCAPAW